MNAFKRFIVIAGLAAASSTAPASDDKTWYVYCEGQGHGSHYAVFSENFWPHSGSDETYGRRVGTAAEAFFEANHKVTLTGCFGVNFFDGASAEYSRERTVQLHRKMGDRIYFFPLPGNVLPE